MKHYLNVVLLSLTPYVSLGEEEKQAAARKVKEELLEKDENYKDVDLNLIHSKEVFLSDAHQDGQSLEASKKKTNLYMSSKKSGGVKTNESDGNLDDSGTINLYHIGGHPTGSLQGSGVSVDGDQKEAFYFLVDREQGNSKKKVHVEGEIFLPPANKEADVQPARRANGKASRRIARDKDRKGKAKKADGQATGNLFQDNRILPNGCVQGTSTFVTKACKLLGCCDGEDACIWPDDQIATVCPNSCNGNKACYNVGAGTLVGWNSCNNALACSYFAEASTKADSSIGMNSCNSFFSCRSICANSEDCEATVGDDACNGDSGCAFTGGKSDMTKSVAIRDRACGGTFACVDLGSYAKSIKIGYGACTGPSYRQCARLGYYTQKKVEVGDYACTSYKSCYYFADDVVKKDVKIQDGECTMMKECAGSSRYYMYNADCNVTPKVPNKDGLCPTD